MGRPPFFLGCKQILSRPLVLHNLWELWCAGFRHSAGLYARVILDGATCRLGDLGDVHDVLGVHGDDHVVPRRRGSAHGGRRVREQPWMTHATHQMTTLLSAHKDDSAILEPSALVVRCALVNKLYYTNLSCEWVSCLHVNRPKHCFLEILGSHGADLSTANIPTAASLSSKTYNIAPGPESVVFDEMLSMFV